MPTVTMETQMLTITHITTETWMGLNNTWISCQKPRRVTEITYKYHISGYGWTDRWKNGHTDTESYCQQTEL